MRHTPISLRRVPELGRGLERRRFRRIDIFTVADFDLRRSAVNLRGLLRRELNYAARTFDA